MVTELDELMSVFQFQGVNSSRAAFFLETNGLGIFCRTIVFITSNRPPIYKGIILSLSKNRQE